MSYASRLGQFNTFTWTFSYNYFDVYIRNGNGERELVSKEYDPYKDGKTEYLDLDNPKYISKVNPGFSTKQKLNELHPVSRHQPNEIGITLHKK